LQVAGVGHSEDRIEPDDFQPIPEEERYLREAIGLYDKSVSLPKFPHDSTFEIEFGRHKETGEVLVYQLKPFRKKQEQEPWIEPRQGAWYFELALGMTPKEGIVVEYHHPWEEGITSPSNADIFYPGGDDNNTYPHVVIPNLEAVIYPVFPYKHSHGTREALMKVPVAPLLNPGTYDSLSANVMVEDQSRLQEMIDQVPTGTQLRVYADGHRGLVEIIGK